MNAAPRGLRLTLLDDSLAVCRCDADSDLPSWATPDGFFSVTRTDDELSVVCREEAVPGSVRHEGGWRALKLEGPFGFSEVGVLHTVTAPLAEAGVSIFAVSTFDTDYVLVKGRQLETAVTALRGHVISKPITSCKEET